MTGKIGLSNSEYMIMSYIWDAGRDLLFGDIFQHFTENGHTWAAQTVKTFLDNLIRKGALAFRWQGHKKIYFAAMPKNIFASQWLKRVVEDNFDNTEDFCQIFNELTGGLTSSQKEELERIWNE